ncbi:hypothetical protein JTB14_029453 [Gonioctena quinquepunctata]|nr:hypothetical protein JTB14_029453 [Gonioctena quinquepunctata]
MGIIYSWLGFGPDRGRTDDLDPVTGLTSRDRYLLRNSWATVMKDATGNGVKLFMRLFEIQPKHLEAFPFRHVPMKDLPQNKKFQAHCNSIIYSFGSMVGVLDDYEIFKSIGEKIGNSHAPRPVHYEALMDVKQAVHDIFSFMNKEELEAWEKFLDLMVKCMYRGIEESNQER